MWAPDPDHLRLMLVINGKIRMIFVQNHCVTRFGKALDLVLNIHLAGVGIADFDGSDQCLAIGRVNSGEG